MNYEETVQYLYSSVPTFQHVGAAGYKEGLENTLTLDDHFQHPHRRFKTIHVAGTNGKGSCSHSLASILQQTGLKVGLYTSPHLIDFRERIRVNGKCISKQYIVDFVEQERSFFEPLHPSFFELTTALAFKYFADQHVNVAVIEVGLGGRLDCTNIIIPILSVITNISYDHTQFLGNTLESIAREKAGIIKENVPVVIGETTPETRPVFEATARRLHAPIVFAEEQPLVEADNIPFELKGFYQAKNKRTILCAAKILHVDKQAIARGLANVCATTGLYGRWQTLQQRPLVVCDTGHNLGGWVYLAKQIAAQPQKQKRIVFGMVDDKDVESVMQLLPTEAIYYWTQASTHRAIPSQRVAELGKKHHLMGTTWSDVKSAYLSALTEADANDFIFVGGSSYVVADLLTFLPHSAD